MELKSVGKGNGAIVSLCRLCVQVVAGVLHH